MNQILIGSYIAQKRRALNLTQEQLSEKLGVSNKTISKWENGKCMPDYSVIQELCDELHVTLAELMAGKDSAEESDRTYNNEQILDLIRRMQELEHQRQVLFGVVLIILGIACSALSATIGGSDVKDFMSGLLLGMSIVEMIAGLIIVVKQQRKK